METLQRTANRGSVSTGYDIDNSVKLEADNTEFFIKNTMTSTGDRRTWTFSGWVKRSELCGGNVNGGVSAQTIYATNVDGNEGTLIRFSTENTSYYDAIQIDIGAGGTNSRSYTKALYRDMSAWYHIVLACDTTQATDTDRFKLYVNGELVTEYASRNNPAQNFDTSNNLSGAYQQLGAYESGGSQYAKFCGYMAECYNIDGQALAPTEFGEFDSATGIWKPKEYTGTFGTNGFYLNFSNASSMGADSSGQGNSLSPQNINQNDQSLDTPTNNFCVLNVLDQRGDTTSVTTEGATVNVQDPGGGTGAMRGTMGVSQGKWYWEFELDLFEGSSFYYLYGVSSLDLAQARYPGQGDGGFSVGVYAQGGNAYFNGSNTAWETSGVGGDGDIIGIFMDLDNGTLKVAKNGTLIGNVGNDIMAVLVNAGISANFNKKFYTAAVSDGTNSSALRTRFLMNFGGYTTISISSAQSDANGYGKFEYSPNDGTYDYYALCSKNIAEFG